MGMRNVFLFIRRYFTFLSFVLLQVLALSILFRYNKTHRAVGMGIANEVTGYFNSQYDNIDDFFHLKEENLRLHKMNDSLLNLSRENFMKVDTGSHVITDTVTYDTTYLVRRYLAKEA